MDILLLIIISILVTIIVIKALERGIPRLVVIILYYFIALSTFGPILGGWLGLYFTIGLAVIIWLIRTYLKKRKRSSRFNK